MTRFQPKTFLRSSSPDRPISQRRSNFFSGQVPFTRSLTGKRLPLSPLVTFTISLTFCSFSVPLIPCSLSPSPQRFALCSNPRIAG